MKAGSIVVGVIVALLWTCPASAETQIRNEYGKVVEIRTRVGNTTRVYDSKRNLIYTATRLGNRIVFRDPGGVVIGVGGPGTISDPRGARIRIRGSGK